MEIKMPKLGLTMTEGTLSAWRVQEGDLVKQGEILFEFESDKSTMEYEAPHTGVVTQILVPAGTTVSCGTVVTILQKGDAVREPAKQPEMSQTAAAAAPQLTTAVAQHTAEMAADAAVPPVLDGFFATPAAKRRARELGVDLAQVHGRGPAGRIHFPDVEAFVRQVAVAGGAAPAVQISPVAKRLAADLGVDVTLLAGEVDGRITRADVLAAVRGGQLRAPAPANARTTPAELYRNQSHADSPCRGPPCNRRADASQRRPGAACHTAYRSRCHAADPGAAADECQPQRCGEDLLQCHYWSLSARERCASIPAVNACLLDDELCRLCRCACRAGCGYGARLSWCR
jgi:pyruvate/2-oxoglutarate dehydrogenase complex dihydrolipoamide acyltransferase (E2) component